MGVSHKKKKMKKKIEKTKNGYNFMTINRTLALKKDQFISQILKLIGHDLHDGVILLLQATLS